MKQNQQQAELKTLPKFPKERAKEIADFILKDIFEDPQFDYNYIQYFLDIASKAITFEIHNDISSDFSVFVQVTLLENLGQSIISASMSLWDQRTDDYVATSYSTNKFTCLVNIYGVFSPENK